MIDIAVTMLLMLIVAAIRYATLPLYCHATPIFADAFSLPLRYFSLICRAMLLTLVFSRDTPLITLTLPPCLLLMATLLLMPCHGGAIAADAARRCYAVAPLRMLLIVGAPTPSEYRRHYICFYGVIA